MAAYRLLTIWRIEAPLADVYAAIHNSLHWPAWWPGVKQVEQVASGDADGIESVRRYAWQGQLPYRVVFDVRATRIEELVALEGTAEGDLEGVGRWHFSRQGKLSVVRYEWHVRSSRWWMNLLAPFARSIFIRNHAQIMEQGGEGLARLLGAPLVSQENIDLMATAPRKTTSSTTSGTTRGTPRGRLRERGRIDPDLAVIAHLALNVALLGGCWLYAANP
jgi:hypothetical protein